MADAEDIQPLTESHAETNITLAEGIVAEHLARVDGLFVVLELRVPRI